MWSAVAAAFPAEDWVAADVSERTGAQAVLREAAETAESDW